MMRLRLLVPANLSICLLALSPLGHGQGARLAPKLQSHRVTKRRKKAPPPPELKKKATIRFSVPAADTSSLWNYCDAQGNIFTVVNPAQRVKRGLGPSVFGAIWDQPITELLLDSRSTATFSLKSLEGYQSLQRITFSVNRRDDVYAIYRARRSSVAGEDAGSWQYVVVKFRDDGSVDSSYRIHNPPGLRLGPLRFAPFADGNLLVTGFADSVAPSRFGPFTGILDQFGRLVTELHLPEDVGPGSKTATPAKPVRGQAAVQENAHGKAQEGSHQSSARPPGAVPGPRWTMAIATSAMASGPGDTVYLLRNSTPPMLYTVSSDGQVIHAVPLRLRVKNLQLSVLSPAGRANVWVDFYSLVKDKEGYSLPSHTFALVDPATGRASVSYRLPPRTNVFFACAAGTNDLEFIGSTKDKKLKVVKYSGH